MSIGRSCKCSVFVVLSLALAAGIACGGGHGPAQQPPPPPNPTPTPAPAPVLSQAPIAGSVTATVGATGAAHPWLSPLSSALTDSCSSGSYTGALVGGGGKQATSGSFTGGAFSVPGGLIPVGKELVLTFSCGGGGTQRCLAKPGDAGIFCDPIADGVLGAFESALGKTVFDPALDGKPISKIASAIVQAAQNDATATAAFTAQVVTCKSATSPGSCDRDAIRSSPFAGAFQMMQVMVNGWTVGDLYTLAVDVFNFEVSIDSFLYSDFGSHMDSWLGTDFVAQSRSFIGSVVADQLAGGNQYIIKVQCQMWYNKKGSDGTFEYPPTLRTNAANIQAPSCINDAAFAKDGLSSTQISLVDAAIAQRESGQNGGGPVDLSPNHDGCNLSPMSWNSMPSDYFCVWPGGLRFASKFTEINRNDPDGTHGYDYYNKPRANMVDAFKEVMQALQSPPPGAPAGCMTFVTNGPPQVNTADAACNTWFQTNIMAPNAKNFSGLFGLYLYLKNPAAYSSANGGLLSLKQVHQLFVQSDYLGSKISAAGNGVTSAQISDAAPNTNNWISPIVTVTTGGLFEVPDAFIWSQSTGMPSLTTTQATALLSAATVPYSTDFQMFESIPSAQAIHDAVFGSGYHTDWNPTGSRFFYAAAVQNTGIPIFCKMTDVDTGKATERPLDAHVRINCLDSTQLAGLTAPDANGVMVMPDGYPYTLQEFGFQGDGKGALFALSDRKTGFRVGLNGAEILLYQISAGNAAGECDSLTLANQVVSAKLNFGWGGNTQNQATQVYCLDTSKLAQPGQIWFRNGGQLTINQTDPSGHTSQWQIPQVGELDPALGSNTLLPVCLFASAQTFTINSGKTSSGLATIDSSGNVTALGDAVVDSCSATSHSALTTVYHVTMGAYVQTTDRTQLKAHLLGNQTQGSQMLQWQTCQDLQCWNNPNVNWDAMNVSIGTTVMETSLGAGRTVAPPAAAAFVTGTKLLNQKWRAKFDPFCDDLDNVGYCKCFVAGTSTPKPDQTSCSLQDDSAYPTMSQPPYWQQSPQVAGYLSMFQQLGGKAGAQLATIVNASGQTVAFDGNYLQQNNLWLDWNEAFKCQYLVTGETVTRSPAQFDWMHPSSLHHGGCPDSSGTINVTSSCGPAGCTVGGGPVRLVNPRPMNNAFTINRPNGLIKMINYATKSTGQGVTIDPAKPLFSVDEAMALVAVRYSLPELKTKVYRADGTTLLSGALPYFNRPELGSNHDRMDVAGAVLRGTLHSSELTAP